MLERLRGKPLLHGFSTKGGLYRSESEEREGGGYDGLNRFHTHNEKQILYGTMYI